MYNPKKKISLLKSKVALKIFLTDHEDVFIEETKIEEIKEKYLSHVD